MHSFTISLKYRQVTNTKMWVLLWVPDLKFATKNRDSN